jgi:peptidyl-tRNA hydrolase
MKTDEDPIVLYLVVRESLDMERGKFGAQEGHAVEKVNDAFWLLEMQSVIAEWDPHEEPLTKEQIAKAEIAREWKKNGSRKVTLKADEKEWAKLKAEFGKEAYVVVDAGITHLEPGTETFMSFWPMRRSARSKSIKRLQAMGR